MNRSPASVAAASLRRARLLAPLAAGLSLAASPRAAAAQASPLPDSFTVGAWTFRPSLDVRIRGEYSFDEKHGTLVLFLHDFRYPYNEFAGSLIALKISPLQTIESIEDVATHKPEYSAELEPELLGAIFQGSWEQRRLVPLPDIPPAFVDAVLAAEDHRFYEHHGIDLVRTARAAWIDLTAHHVLQGGSGPRRHQGDASRECGRRRRTPR